MNGRFLSARVLLALLLSLLVQPSMAADPLPHHGWILTQDDMAYNQSVIARMRDYGVTHVQLSHRIVTRIDQFADDAVAARVQTLARDIHGQGGEVIVWAQELAFNALTFCFDPDGDDMRARMQAYRYALTQVPEIDGVMISFGSAPSELYLVLPSCQPAKYLSVHERYKAMIEAVSRVVQDEFGKQVYVRTFYHKNFEIPFLRQALSETQRPIIAMSKAEPNDFAPYYPLDPLIGSLGAHDQFLELDCAGEYWGRSQLPFVAAEYFAQRYRESLQAVAAGEGRFVGSACRVDRYEHSAFGTANEANIAAQAALVKQPDAHWQDILSQHIASRYGLAVGTDAHRTLFGILQRSYWIGRKMYYAKGDWAFKKGSNLPASNAEALGLLLDKNTGQWNDDYKPITRQLMAPNQQTLLDLLQEKQEAIDLAERNLQAFAALQGSLDSASFTMLETLLIKQRVATEIWFHAAGAIFGSRHNATHLPGAARLWIPWHVSELERLADALEQQTYPQINDPFPFPPGDLRALANNTRDPLLSVGDAQAPQWLRIDGIDVDDIDTQSVRIRWNAKAGARYRIDVTKKLPNDSQSVPHDSVASEDGPTSLVVGGLEPQTPYWVRVHATRGQEQMVSGDYPFWTQKIATTGPSGPPENPNDNGGGAIPLQLMAGLLILLMYRCRRQYST